MIINLASTSWGPQFLVPTASIKKYFGRIMLRETLDDELLKKELKILHISGHPIGVTNAWYIRKKGIQTWIKLGESSYRQRDFAVCFDSKDFENGTYQILGFMSIKVKTADKEFIVSKQNIADLDIKN
jgi:hypothetical protein